LGALLGGTSPLCPVNPSSPLSLSSSLPLPQRCCWAPDLGLMLGFPLHSRTPHSPQCEGGNGPWCLGVPGLDQLCLMAQWAGHLDFPLLIWGLYPDLNLVLGHFRPLPLLPHYTGLPPHRCLDPVSEYPPLPLGCWGAPGLDLLLGSQLLPLLPHWAELRPHHYLHPAPPPPLSASGLLLSDWLQSHQ
ncbi:hypothetical protein ANANG_G00052840, partial [Anguilla anguilla]